MKERLLLPLLIGVPLVSFANIGAQQIADPAFDVAVTRPAYARDRGPIVVVDEAHANRHTAAGGYKPFADLLVNDGYRIQPGRSRFSSKTLESSSILVIANAMSAANQSQQSAFTDEECDRVAEWVREGGSLFLISDHAPAGEAAAKLATRFSVKMGLGYVFDPKHTELPDTSTIVFSNENGLLGNHWIMRGRNSSEAIRRVLTFSGQSVTVPVGATALLRLSPTAVEPLLAEDVRSVVQAMRAGVSPPFGIPSSGPAQAIAMPLGEGRVVMAGEAALFSAQLLKEGRQEFRFGMNSPGADNRQLALNVMHWLSRLDE